MIKRTGKRSFKTDSYWVMLITLILASILWILTLGYHTLYINGKGYGGWGEKRKRE